MGKNEGAFRTEEELYAYWLEIGGTEGWRSNTTGEQLSEKLADCNIEKANPALKEGQWIHKVVVVDEKEITGYISVLLSRLPKLRKLRIYACKEFMPFDFEAIDEVGGAFPCIEHFGFIRSMWDEPLVTALEERFPTLRKRTKLLSRGCGVGVYREHGPTKKEEELKELLKDHKKLEVLD